MLALRNHNSERAMPYKVHLLNKERGPVRIAGFDTQIVTETPPLQVVDTKEEAQQAMLELIAQGVRPFDLYAAGYDYPPTRP